MIGIDTNVLARFLLGDDIEQQRISAEFLSRRTPGDPAFVSFVVLIEVVWLMRSVHKIAPKAVADAVRQLLTQEAFVFEDHEYLSTLLASDVPGGADLADHLVSRAAQRAGCAVVVTFDRRAARLVPGMRLIA